MNALYAILSLFRSLGALLLWPIELFRPARLSTPMRIVVEVLLVALVVGGLALLNMYLGLEQYLNGPPAVKRVYLGILALLLYAAVRLAIYILQQLPAAAATFPDIDEALEEGLAALAHARIYLKDTPLFLVLGTTSESDLQLANSPLVGKALQVADPRLPVHWFGDGEAIWLTLPGVSSLSRQVDPRNEIASQTPGGSGVSMATRPPAAMVDEPVDMYATQTPGNAGPYATIGAIARPQAMPKPTTSAAAERFQASSRQLSVEEKDEASQRLEYLIKKLKELRYPVCPANGILLALPFDWTSSPQLSRLAETVTVDMMTLEATLGIRCATLVVFHRIERSAPFTEYIGRLGKGQVERRCGCGLPALTPLDTNDLEPLHEWLMHYFERHVFELYQAKLGDPGNGLLFRFLNDFRNSKANFVRMLNSAFPKEMGEKGMGEPFYVGGVYFAGFGNVGKVARPFLDGVLHKLKADSDSAIGWNEQSLVEDRRLAQAANIVMVGVVLLTLLAGLLVLAIFLRW